MYRMVFAQIFRGIIAAGVGGLLFSCTAYRTLHIEVLEPAQLALDSGARIGLLNRNIIYRVDSMFPLYQYEGITRKDLYHHFQAGVNDVFLSEGRFDTVLPLEVQVKTFLPDQTRVEPFSPSALWNMYREFKVDYLISLEFHTYHPLVKKDYIAPAWFVRLYDCRMDSLMNSVLLIGEKLKLGGSREEMIEEVAVGTWEEGQKYARKITPHWEKTERRIYNKGKILRLGDVFFREGKINQAFDLWMAAYQKAGKQSLRAAINLAWLYENSDDFEQALQILEQAETKEVKLKDRQYAEMYIEEIKKRTEKRDKLVKQGEL